MKGIPSNSASFRIILTCALISVVLYATLAVLGDLRLQMLKFLVIIAGLWGVHAYSAQKLCGVFLPLKTDQSFEDLQPQVRDQQAKLIILCAILFRAIILPTAPWLSDDIYRYLWDGRVVMHGLNPYQWPPNAPQLAALRDAAVFPYINHPHINTIYPPFLQAVFALAQLLGGTILSMKALFTVIDIALLVSLFLTLRGAGRDPRQVLIYAWNPMPILEISGSGHADVVVGIFFLLAIVQLGKAQFRGAAVILSLGFLTKFASVLILPFIWVRRHLRNAALIFGVIVLLGYLPFLSAGGNLFSGLFTFSAKWRFNDSIFSLIYWPFERMLPDSLVIAWMFGPGWEVTAQALSTRRVDLALLIAKAIVGVIFLSWMIWLGRRFRKEENSFDGWGRLFILLYAGLLLLSPTFQPWYLLWILPLLAIWPNRSLLLLSGMVFLSYWILQVQAMTGVWREQAPIKYVEFAPVFALMVYDWYRVRRKTLISRK